MRLALNRYFTDWRNWRVWLKISLDTRAVNLARGFDCHYQVDAGKQLCGVAVCITGSLHPGVPSIYSGGSVFRRRRRATAQNERVLRLGMWTAAVRW